MKNTNIQTQNITKSIIYTLSTDINNQKNFIKYLNNLINNISTGNKESISMLDNINNILPIIISEIGITISDLILNNKEIINYYINTYIKTKTIIIKNILINLINVFNFKSININPSNNISQLLQNHDDDIKQMINNKRSNKTEIEDMYDCLMSLYNNINNANVKEGIQKYQPSIKEIEHKVNEMENKNIYTNATIQYLKEKINGINELINAKINNVNKINIIPNLNNINNNGINKINNISNNFNFLNFPFFHIFNGFNNINIPNNNGLTNEELNKLKEIPLKDRKFFYMDEELTEGEDEYIEFKHYSYPFTQEKIDEIKRQYCGFLNSHGGRIYLGITDLRVVKGIYLDYKSRDTIRNELINYTYDFYPKCRLNKINVYFIPIKSIQNKNIIPNKYVIQIIILPGEPHILYSLTNKGGFISTLRLPGQCINLTAEEIYVEIMRRGELLKEKYTLNNNQFKDDDEDDDENNDTKEDENHDIEEMNEENEESEESNDTTQSNKKIVYVVQIKNIDKSLKIKDINRFFNGCGSSYQHFPAENGNSKGYGEIHFSKKETAKSFIQKYNRISLRGKKQINMILKKRKTIIKEK